MRLELQGELGEAYHNGSQIARVVTERWVKENMFCPRCGKSHIFQYQNNKPVADFYCESCQNQYELKSKKSDSLDSVPDGAYATMIARIISLDNPDFFFMSYNPFEWKVRNFYFVPKHFFTPGIIEKRKPLSPNARRAGWIGCNIRLKDVPVAGKIPIIENGVVIDKSNILKRVSLANRMVLTNLDGRGWLFDVLSCVEAVPGDGFTLNDIYAFENKLAMKYPENHNIRAKIRQQLQLLRDRGIIEFCGKGTYRKVLQDYH